MSRPTIDQLHQKARKLARAALGEDEELVAVIPGRSKQAMLVTDRRILMLKPGILAGAWLGPKAAAFPLTAITTINVHTGRGLGALELVITGNQKDLKPDLTTAFQAPNWLPCQPSVSGSSLIAELRTYVQTDGQSPSARAQLGAFDGHITPGRDRLGGSEGAQPGDSAPEET